MASFNVYRHPQTGNLEAVKQGYCFPILLLNIVVPLGWMYAFIRRASHFAWRLLALSIIAVSLMYNFPGVPAGVIALFWLVFSVSLGASANKRIEFSLKRRGFTLLHTNVTASNADAAIETATAGPAAPA